jgi:hypothetical protein
MGVQAIDKKKLSRDNLDMQGSIIYLLQICTRGDNLDTQGSVIYL